MSGNLVVVSCSVSLRNIGSRAFYVSDELRVYKMRVESQSGEVMGSLIESGRREKRRIDEIGELKESHVQFISSCVTDIAVNQGMGEEKSLLEGSRIEIEGCRFENVTRYSMREKFNRQMVTNRRS